MRIDSNNIKESLKFNKLFEFLNDTANEKLKINKDLPHFFVPSNKAELFINWYDNDLQDLRELPQIYNDYYITIETDFLLKIIGPSIFDQNNFINDDYMKACKLYNNLKNELKYITIHVFYVNSGIKMNLYNNDDLTEEVSFNGHKSNMDILEILGEENFFKDNHLYRITINKYQLDIADYFYPSEKNLPSYTQDSNNKDLSPREAWINFIVLFAADLLRICIANIWYVATYNLKNKNITTTKERLKSLEEINPEKLEKSKGLKILTRKIYNLEKIKNHITVGRLIKCRKGWSVSVEHAVKGHWRHYKDGKAVFIESYTRCKGRGQKQTSIILNPKSYEDSKV